MRQAVHTDRAPEAIGTYSQAVRFGSLVFVSGQIPLDPDNMELVGGDMTSQVQRVFDNLSAICSEAGGTLDQIVKLTVFLTDMDDFPVVNEVMGQYFQQPYPARAAIGVAALPKGVAVEMDAILALDDSSF